MRRYVSTRKIAAKKVAVARERQKPSSKGRRNFFAERYSFYPLPTDTVNAL